MATGSFPAAAVPFSGSEPGVSVGSAAWRILRALGSLKITVVMFLAATFLLLVGTLAQDEKNLPEVKVEYFTSWIARVPFSDFFPVTICGPSSLTGWFPFPGGATIGLVLLVNLIAAKATRFHVAAAGQRLLWGTVVTAIGGLLTLAVILTGHRTDGLQGSPPVDYDTVWRLVQAGGLVLAGGLGAAAWRGERRLVRGVLAATAALVGGLVAATLAGGAAWRLDEPGLRIMWQLMQSSVAAGVLLAGLVMVFGARGGNVLIHVAVGLLMLGQFAFGDRQIERRMTLVEGQTTNMAFRADEVELALIDMGDPRDDRVTALSGRLLAARAGGAAIEADGLPFAIRVVEYMPNSDVVRVGPVAPNPATAGLGRGLLASVRPPEGGVSSKSNVASAYVQLTARPSGRDCGTYLVTQYLNDQPQLFMGSPAEECDTVDVDGRPWRLQLRFRREYKPYDVTLTDVRRIDYSASETPRDYSSYVTFTDRGTGAEQQGRIWMNNPVRYRGETFYQSQYSKIDLGGGREGEVTGLQVVENAGWLIPYVACVLAFWGMLAHFGGTFLRYAERRDRGAAAGRGPAAAGGWLIPAAALGVVAACTLPAARPPPAGADTGDWRAAGALPVMHEGRVKPLDSVARTTLQLLGDRTAVRMPASEDATAGREPGGPTGTVPAARWLLAHMAGSGWVDAAPVFRIDALEVLDFFDLTRRQGHRYSAADIEAGRDRLRRQMQELADTPREQWTFTQQKLAELNHKLMAYDLIRLAYQAVPLPRPAGDDDASRHAHEARVRALEQGARMLERNHPVAAIPPPRRSAEAAASADPAGRWQALYPAVATAAMGRMLADRPDGPAFEINPALPAFIGLLAAVDARPGEFNAVLADYRRAIEPLLADAAGRAATEAWLNAFRPADLAKWLYVAATVLCFASFLGWHRPLNRFVSWMLVGTLMLHTFAIASRIWLTGRPPVVNLYSSAVFIGWACVLAGIGLEALSRQGIGNLVAALAGGLTLLVAHGLDSGDTMHVLQAVLDTQFWLSTHVVTVTLGYGATFLAGLLGTCAIVHRIWSRWAGSATAVDAGWVQDQLTRMTYGVICFALFFSFIGTVLGGLWADDSWGRFWGWDPKENGALMIVLWNAAVLHARWDRWIGPRGLALFAIGGNIVTAWSWFGTNQLGIGLHSYGFTSGVLLLLAGYVASQLALMAAGWLLTRPAAADA